MWQDDQYGQTQSLGSTAPMPPLDDRAKVDQAKAVPSTTEPTSASNRQWLIYVLILLLLIAVAGIGWAAYQTGRADAVAAVVQAQPTPIQPIVVPPAPTVEPTRVAVQPVAVQPLATVEPAALIAACVRNEQGVLRERIYTNIGDGPLSKVSYSDGAAPCTDDYMHKHFPSHQRIWFQQQFNGCDTARVASDSIWFVTQAPAAITINNQQIAYVEQTTPGDGYIFGWPVRVGDKVCINGGQSGTTPRLFYLWLGMDNVYWQDTHCYRGNCVGWDAEVQPPPPPPAIKP